MKDRVKSSDYRVKSMNKILCSADYGIQCQSTDNRLNNTEQRVQCMEYRIMSIEYRVQKTQYRVQSTDS